MKRNKSISFLNVTAAICTHERPDDVSRCLTALVAQARVQGFSVLVIDSASSPAASARLVELCRSHAAQYVRVDMPGLSRARNAALAYSNAEWVAFLDDDTEPHATWASGLADILATTGADTAIIGGKVLPHWPEGVAAPDLPAEWLLMLSCVMSNEAGDVRQGHNIVGANFVVRRQVVQSAGGFPLTLGRTGTRLVSCEESYLIEKLSMLDHRCLYEPAFAVEHHIHPDRLESRWARKRAYWEGYSRVLMFRALGRPLPRSLNIVKLALSVPVLWVWQKFCKRQDLAMRFEKTWGSFRAAAPRHDV